MKKLICHAEFIIGEKLTDKDLERLIEKGFDHALFQMSHGLDITLDSDLIYTKTTKGSGKGQN